MYITSTYNDSVPTAHRIQFVSTKNTAWLMLHAETISVYLKNHTKHVTTLRGQNGEFINVKGDGIPTNHGPLDG